MRLAVEAVTKRYGSTRALDGVSLEFPEGKVSVLLGPSGSGKSTLLRLLNRMLEPDSGRILVDGREAETLDSIALRRSMGYVVQGIGLFPHLTVGENIAIAPELLGWPKARIDSRILELLNLVRLSQDYVGRFPRQLSGGEAQRVGVARALAANPPVLLMDEPFGALDIQTRVALQAEFLRIQQSLEKTVVFVTHDVAEAVLLGDRLSLLYQGRLVQSGPALEFLLKPAEAFVRDFFGSRYRLELLGRIPVAPLITKKNELKKNSPESRNDKSGGSIKIIEPSASLADALLAMLESGMSWVEVAGTDNSVVRFQDLARELSDEK